MTIKVIDLFAGPGGLGEGFSAFKFKNKHQFKIAISIEKEESAHRTLLLRAFFRQFSANRIPDEYYAFLKGQFGKNPEDELYKKYPKEHHQACLEAQRITLGEVDQEIIYKKIRDHLDGDECILIGGPPCQAYSVIGRSRNHGDKQKNYNASEDGRNFLYLEYLKIIAKFQPKIFVMENVKGILSAKINGNLIFDSILNDLENPYKSTQIEPDTGRNKQKYKIFSLSSKNGFGNLSPKDYIIKSEEYGIPQNRHRVILLGVREDLLNEGDTSFQLPKAKFNSTVKDVIYDLPKLRSKLSKGGDSTEKWRDAIWGINDNSLEKLFDSDLVPEKVYTNYVNYINTIGESPTSTGSNQGLQKPKSISRDKISKRMTNWYKDSRLEHFVTNHESRGHITGDLHRYLYYSTYAKYKGISPNAKNLPKVLWPKHKNFKTGKFSDRFRVQLENSQSSTVTSHISKDGHFFIHPDPSQCRSLTVREAARIQTFPDNYYFVGTRTQQYVQVGNAVPPFLALQIATIVHQFLEKKL